MNRPALLAAALALAASLPVTAQVNYHQAQQAGKVWGDKIGENNRQAARERNARKNSEGVRYDAPLTAADLAAARTASRADYDRLVDSVGPKNANRWLEFEARKIRAAR